MTKQVFVPLVSLASGDADSFLELRSEQDLSGQHDCFFNLGIGLKPAVLEARRALQTLPEFVFDGSIYIAGACPTLASPKDVALALALCPWLLQANFLFGRCFVLGHLSFPEAKDGHITVTAGRYLQEQLQAVLRLGYQVDPALLIMPTSDIETDYRHFAEKNIAVRSVATLTEAYEKCISSYLVG